MKKTFILLLLLSACKTENQDLNFDFTTPFETSKGTETATYKETITFYENLAKVYPEITIKTIGETDSGKPLHIVTLNPDTNFNFSSSRANKRVILINNGIHPGESDGIDATMLLYRDIVQNKIEMPKSTVLVTIPIYNVGGSLNRNTSSRTNQNGPKAYGFRGNARNFDLNRDFIKSDTKNARTFAKIFHLVKPDVFIDNHVSNGADYQYTLTHLFTQHNKLGGALGNYLHTRMMPELESKLSEVSWDITPYVNVFNSVPEKGFSQFMDSPRYSTGYTTLFNTLGMMVETHMLKPYKKRVEGTYELMKKMIVITENDGELISKLRANSYNSYKTGTNYSLNWTIDTSKASTINFKGYEGSMIPSEITNAQRLKFDISKPFIKKVQYRNYFKAKDSVTIPKAYIVPQGWHNIIALLKLNNIKLKQLKNDSTITVENYKINTYKSRTSPYEGHYLHYNTSVESTIKPISFRAGDYIVNTNQNGVRYLIETLEPQAPDSFFNWNFFDTILQQKEGFSPYVWEDKAKTLLDSNEELKQKFEAKKQSDDNFAKSWYVQLDWLHKQSDNYEKAHLQYPIYRIN